MTLIEQSDVSLSNNCSGDVMKIQDGGRRHVEFHQKYRASNMGKNGVIHLYTTLCSNIFDCSCDIRLSW